ncbi:hypothetical protein [Tissierella pigra]|uniref:hypothetical protein n=1 Tax=Tissierella pigra TaxID=2607614 RepID=UPI0012B36812|nr:hypothetical protein [Tissierella pigra]
MGLKCKLNNDSGHLNIRTIDKVMNYLSIRLNRSVTVEEIIKFIPDETDLTEE